MLNFNHPLPMLYLSQTNAPDCVVDYCAGPDPVFQRQLLATVITILAPISESIDAYELQQQFPSYARKPINLDPCWTKLQTMSYKILHETLP
jgi:hypothetical protein